jgi:2'-5' RNA ligase
MNLALFSVFNHLPCPPVETFFVNCPMPAPQPLIVTLAIDNQSLEYFTRLRNEYFPAWCNYLPAHITLFHRLPPGLPLIIETIEKYARRKPFSLGITGIKHMGTGVAFTIGPSEINQLHKEMKTVFKGHLTAQDRKKIWPHITVQNKVSEWKALQTAEKLASGFTPFSIEATGFSLWKYNKGPWLHVQDRLFEE